VTRQLPPEVVAAWLDRRRAEWTAAGLPEHVEDRATLDRIAAIVTAGTPSRSTDDAA
jgi:hypothetical protein